MRNVAWKHCGTALVPSGGACDKLGGARRDRKDEPKRQLRLVAVLTAPKEM